MPTPSTRHNLARHVADYIGRHRLLAALGLFALLLLFLLFPARRDRTSKRAVELSPVAQDEFERALVTRYEKRFDELQTQFETDRQDLRSQVAQTQTDLVTMQDEITQGFEELRRALSQRQTVPPVSSPPAAPPGPLLRRIGPGQESGNRHTRATQRAANTDHLDTSSSPAVQLPAGSFVKSTFLNGVYAPADQNRPLPVLLRVNEGFTGPNRARVPLEGCLALGKAAADLGSERATIQLATLSCVLPSGAVFERDVSGYVVGNDGTFGVQGTLVRHDASKIGMATLTGFLAGAGQALSRAESTVIVSPTTGATTSAVTGNTARFAALAGLSETANQLSRYYLDLARQITPAIQVPSGVDVHLVMHRGVTIEGLQADDLQAEPVRYATRRG